MSTFSQMIDALMTEIVRPDMVAMLPGFLNQTIRECHSGVTTQEPIFFDEGRKENLVTAAGVTDGVYLWPIPSTPHFQAIDAVYYRKYSVYASPLSPQVIRDVTSARPNDRFAYYRTGPYFAFRGFGTDGDLIDLSWFEYPRSLVYYLAGDSRPLSFDPATLAYTQPTGATITLEEAKTLTTNWLIERHTEMLKEGVRAKAYKRMSDEFRANLCYSQFKQMLAGMQQSEGAQQGVYRHK